jgi:hypothetical protein
LPALRRNTPIFQQIQSKILKNFSRNSKIKDICNLSTKRHGFSKKNFQKIFREDVIGLWIGDWICHCDANMLH